MKQKKLFGSAASDLEPRDNVDGTPKKPPPKPAQKKKKQPFDASSAKPTWLSKTTEDDGLQKDDGGEPSEAAAPRAPRLECTRDDELDRFLIDVKAETSGAEWQAKQYLLSDMPYKGVHAKGFKEQLKEAGAKWMRNPNAVEGVFDADVPFGWFVACSVKDLRSLLEVKRTSSGDKAWKPANVSDEESDNVIRRVLELLDEFEEFKRAKLEREREANAATRRAQEANLKAAAVGRVWDDAQQDIDKLEALLGGKGTYDADLIRSSATFIRLGPPMSTNVRRVLRGLHLKIITLEDVKNGDFNGNDPRWAKQPNKRKPETGETSQSATLDIESFAFDGEKKKKKKKKKTTTMKEEEIDYLMTDEQLAAYRQLEKEEEDQRLMDENGLKVCPASTLSLLTDTSLRKTTCPECNVGIDDQFLDCACDGRKWSKCRECFHAYVADMPDAKPANKTSRSAWCCRCSCDFPDVQYPVEHASDVEVGQEAERSGAEPKNGGESAKPAKPAQSANVSKFNKVENVDDDDL